MQELERTIKFEKALIEEKSSKFELLEAKMKELELRYQNELMLMQNEINRIKDNEVNRNSQNKVEN